MSSVPEALEWIVILSFIQEEAVGWKGYRTSY